MVLILQMDQPGLQQAQQSLQSQLRTLYDDREAATITDWVMEHVTGLKKIDRILHKKSPLSPDNTVLLKKYTEELLAHRPVQYVLGESWFRGLKFYVDEQVLIPRPETEELVEWVLEEASSRSLRAVPGHHAPPESAAIPPHPPGHEVTTPPEFATIPTPPMDHTAPAPTPTLLDVGTGSGCIAISLKKALPGAEVYACDLSGAALDIAQRNAAAHQTAIHFRQLDFLDPAQWGSLPLVQVLVSNPPYIPLRDKASMAPHVLRFEPHLALFVDNRDPLVFYRALAGFARQKLLPGGSIFVEIHEDLAAATRDLFKEAGFQQVIVRKDMQGKDRMIKAS